MWRSAGLGLACAFALVLASAHEAAAAGSNSIAGAPELAYSVPDTGDTTGFTIEPAELGTANAGPDVCGLRGRTAWWKVRGHGAGMVVTTQGSDFTGVIAVYIPNTSGGPGSLRGCAAGALRTLRMSFPADRGDTYLIQVGGAGATGACPNTCADSGRVTMTAIPERPANDDLLAARPIGTGEVPEVSNAGATQEPGEQLTCFGAPYAGTLWFSWSTGVPGTAVFEANAAFTDTVIAVYRSDGAFVGCNDDAAQPDGPSALAARVGPGTYLLQVGAAGADGRSLGQGIVRPKVSFAPKDDDGDGVTDPPDCNDVNPAVRQGARDVPEDGVDQDCDGSDAINLDRDGDGNVRPSDCDDNDPSRFRGARDIPRNRKDEDCNGRDADFPFITSAIQYAVAKQGRSTTLTRLTVVRPPARARVRVTCLGRGCKRRTITRRVRRGTARIRLARSFRGARLAPGTVVRVRVTKPGLYGKELRLTMRRVQLPRKRSRCIDPRNARLRRC